MGKFQSTFGMERNSIITGNWRAKFFPRILSGKRNKNMSWKLIYGESWFVNSMMKILFDQINSPWWCNRYSKDVRHNELSIASAKNTPAFLNLIGICKCSKWKNNFNNGKAICKKEKSKKIFKKFCKNPAKIQNNHLDWCELVECSGKKLCEAEVHQAQSPHKTRLFQEWEYKNSLR